eukprot:gene4234-2216_t
MEDPRVWRLSLYAFVADWEVVAAEKPRTAEWADTAHVAAVQDPAGAKPVPGVPAMLSALHRPYTFSADHADDCVPHCKELRSGEQSWWDALIAWAKGRGPASDADRQWFLRSLWRVAGRDVEDADDDGVERHNEPAAAVNVLASVGALRTGRTEYDSSAADGMAVSESLVAARRGRAARADRRAAASTAAVAAAVRKLRTGTSGPLPAPAAPKFVAKAADPVGVRRIFAAIKKSMVAEIAAGLRKAGSHKAAALTDGQ